jgi:DNA-binding winged helix-turn-helix (wHTH) protein
VDARSRRVWLGDKELVPPLSFPQFRLLQILYEQQGEVVERQDLINYIWGEEESIGVSEQAFDALVRRLRERLAAIDSSHVFIITVRGHGLRLENPLR